MPPDPATVIVGQDKPRAQPPAQARSLDDRRTVEPALTALARVHLAYFWRHRRRLSIARPTRFTELVQRRKLIERDARMPRLIDKLMVKSFVAARLGKEWITPTLWSGTTLPETPPCTGLCVVKSRHGCGQVQVVDLGAVDWGAVRLAASAWGRRPYGRWLDEWGYRDVPRGVLIEPFVGTVPTLPIDYKLYVFHGRVAAIQVHVDRAADHRWSLYDRSWRKLSSARPHDDVRPPSTLAQMIDGAETLGADFDFVRVDFYDVGPVPRFGEMTFYPGSGLDRFDPPELDAMLGMLWLAGPWSDDDVPAAERDGMAS